MYSSSTLFTYIQRTNYGKVINNLMSYCPIRKVWPQNNAIMYFERNKEFCANNSREKWQFFANTMRKRIIKLFNK